MNHQSNFWVALVVVVALSGCNSKPTNTPQTNQSQSPSGKASDNQKESGATTQLTEKPNRPTFVEATPEQLKEVQDAFTRLGARYRAETDPFTKQAGKGHGVSKNGPVGNQVEPGSKRRRAENRTWFGLAPRLSRQALPAELALREAEPRGQCVPSRAGRAWAREGTIFLAGP